METGVEKNVELFFITGMPKSGTTWCANFFNQLEGVVVLGEGRFFGGELKNFKSLYHGLYEAVSGWVDFIGKRKGNWLGTDDYIRTINKTNYVSSFYLEKITDHIAKTLVRSLVYDLSSDAALRGAREGGKIFVGDKTPVLNPDELQKWTECFPREKFVVLLRNFIDWSVSIALHFYYSNVNNRVDRGITLFDDEDLIRIHDFKLGHASNIISRERLCELSKRYRRIRDKIYEIGKLENVILIKYEDLFSDPESKFEEMCSFLGLDITIDQIRSAVEKVSIRETKKFGDDLKASHIRVAVPGKGEEFFDMDLSEFDVNY